MTNLIKHPKFISNIRSAIADAYTHTDSQFLKSERIRTGMLDLLLQLLSLSETAYWLQTSATRGLLFAGVAMRDSRRARSQCQKIEPQERKKLLQAEELKAS